MGRETPQWESQQRQRNQEIHRVNKSLVPFFQEAHHFAKDFNIAHVLGSQFSTNVRRPILGREQLAFFETIFAVELAKIAREQEITPPRDNGVFTQVAAERVGLSMRAVSRGRDTADHADILHAEISGISGAARELARMYRGLETGEYTREDIQTAAVEIVQRLQQYPNWYQSDSAASLVVLLHESKLQKPRGEYSTGSDSEDSDANWDVRADVVGYAYEGKWRIGDVREVITSPQDIAPLFAILYTPFTEEDGIQRNMARAVITRDMLTNPPARLRLLLDRYAEAVIPVDHPDLPNCYQVIFGRNSASHRSSKELQEQEIEQVKLARSGRKEKVQTDREAVLNRYTLLRLTKADLLRPEWDYKRQALEAYLKQIREEFSEEDRRDLEEDFQREAHEVLFIIAVETENLQGSRYSLRANLELKERGELSEVMPIAGGIHANQDRTHVRLRRDEAVQDITLQTYEIENIVVVQGVDEQDAHRGQGLFRILEEAMLHDLAEVDPPVNFLTQYVNAGSPELLRVAATIGGKLGELPDRALSFRLHLSQQQNKVGDFVDDVIWHMSGTELRESNPPQ